MTDTTDPARELAAHIADQPVSVVQAALRHLGMRLHFELQDLAVGQNPAGTAHRDGHTGVSGATEPTGDPRAAETANGPQTAVQDLEQWSAIINNEVDPDYAAQKLLALRDQDRATHDKWTRAVEQRNTRLRGELRQLRAELTQLSADVDHRDQSIRHLENGLRHERDIVDRVRAVAKNYPGLTALRNALADHATPGEVLPDELLRLIDMHKYVSTACDTAGACETAAEAEAQVDDADKLTDQAARLHQRCRRTHKFTGAPCACDCHHTTAKEAR